MKADSGKSLPWFLILSLGALALIRPIMSMTGLLKEIGQPVASLTVTLLISLMWLIVGVYKRVQRPVLTFVLVGLSYGMYTVILSAVLSLLLAGQLQGPMTNPLAMISVFIINAFWGFIVGLAAWAMIRSLNRSDLG